MYDWLQIFWNLIKMIFFVGVIVCGVLYLFDIHPILGVVSGIIIGLSIKINK